MCNRFLFVLSLFEHALRNCKSEAGMVRTPAATFKSLSIKDLWCPEALWRVVRDCLKLRRFHASRFLNVEMKEVIDRVSRELVIVSECDMLVGLRVWTDGRIKKEAGRGVDIDATLVILS